MLTTTRKMTTRPMPVLARMLVPAGMPITQDDQSPLPTRDLALHPAAVAACRAAVGWKNMSFSQSLPNRLPEASGSPFQITDKVNR